MPDPTPQPDTGEVPQDLAAAMTAYGDRTGTLADVLVVLQGSRLLVPMVEVPADTFPAREHEHVHDEDHGPGHGGGQMAAVSLRRPDGRTGLLAFTGVEPLRRWNPDARPLPLTAREAAETALGDGASALVVDVAGPVQVAVQGDDLAALGQGWTLALVGADHVWVPPEA